MNCRIASETRGRIRVVLQRRHLSVRDADILEYYLSSIDGVDHVDVHERTGSVTIRYRCARQDIIAALASYQGATKELNERTPVTEARLVNRQYQDKAFYMIAGRVVRRAFLPLPVRTAFAWCKGMRFIWRAIMSLRSKKLKVEVLDAISVTVSLIRGDAKTAGNVMFLLDLGDLLGEWTRKKSMGDLAKSMSLNVDRVWLKTDDGEILTPVSRIQPGDLIIVHHGNLIPLDGKVVEGEAMVNQASMTGEPLAVRKSRGSVVFAGTAVEEGDCVVEVSSASGSGRYDRIVKMIEQSEKMKSATESRALNLADSLVPYSLATTALVWLLTRNVQKAVSVLMVDYSCALKLCMPLTVIGAMRECSEDKIVVKGGKFLEAVAKADTIVFDKTGTLTEATPRVAKVIPFGGRSEEETLRIAACLEEHFPHSIANAVVQEAVDRGIEHSEMHSEVQYLVAHGIASSIDGKKAIIGSYHFVFEDEKCTIPKTEQTVFDNLDPGYSLLYLAIDQVLAGVLCISDPLRPEVSSVISSLKELGIGNIVMMTGDSERTARAIAAQAGVDHYYAEVLPEDKAGFVAEERRKGRTVIMLGDGINDSPALSEADAGIAVSDGAAIARQIADITIQEDDLEKLVILKMIANAMQKRVNFNYRFVMGFNSGLILLGMFGVLAPGTSALLHNVSTFGISVRSLTPLLKEHESLIAEEG